MESSLDVPKLLKYKFMSRKGVYPYDYMIHLVSSRKEGSQDGRTSTAWHAQDVWQTFGLETMGDYQDLYLTSDVLLLPDVFENSRKPCLQSYSLLYQRWSILGRDGENDEDRARAKY